MVSGHPNAEKRLNRSKPMRPQQFYLPSTLALFFLGLVCLAGCATLTRMQFQVRPAPPSAPGMAAGAISPEERAALLEIVGRTAARLNMKEATAYSMVPATLACYIERDIDYPVKLVVWEHEESILVDVLQQSGTVGETKAYRLAREKLLHDLQQQFGNRFRIVPLRSHISAPPKK